MAYVYDIIRKRQNGNLIGKTAYPLQLTQDHEDRLDLFHFAVWLAGNDVADFMLLASLDTRSSATELCNTPKVVLFGRREERDAYLAWLKKIKPWFVRTPMETTFLPLVPFGTSMNLSITDCNEDTRWGVLSDISLFTAWSWITHNCEQPVWRIDGGFAFSSPEEAVKFKIIAPDMINENHE